MKKYLSMISFVLIMGIVSTAVLMGADFVTKDAIARNREYTWKTAVLSHHEIAFTDANFDTVFDESFEVSEATDLNGNTRSLYTNTANGSVSYQFTGGGLWDVIEGVISLENDFKTIIKITVTKQGETPGLGGVVAEEPYLNNYIGKVFDETLGLVAIKDGGASLDYEVDAITGATGTSNAFVGLLSSEYRIFLSLFGDVNLDAAWMKIVLEHNDIAFTDDNFNSLFGSNITTATSNNLTLYTHTTSGNVSFKFEATGFQGPIQGVLTLASDFKTIVGITVYEQAEGWGARIQTQADFFDAYVGKKFDPTISFVETPTTDSEIVDGYGGATTTKAGMLNSLNTTVATYVAAFKEGA